MGSLGIVCGCDGLLSKQGTTTAVCRVCKATYPLDELAQILKLLRKADYMPADAAKQSPPSEEEKRTAINMAARKLARLKLRVVDLNEVQPAPPPPRPVYSGVPVQWAANTTTVTGANSSIFGNIFIRVNIT